MTVLESSEDNKESIMSALDRTEKVFQEQRRSTKHLADREQAKEALQVLNEWRKKNIDLQPTGGLYKVKIGDAHYPSKDVNDEDLLHWDKKISEQSPKVQNSIKNILREYKVGRARAKEIQDITGENFYNLLYSSMEAPDTKSQLVRGKIGIPKAVTDFMHGHGVKGVKYLDQYSRRPVVIPVLNGQEMAQGNIRTLLQDLKREQAWNSDLTDANILDHGIERSIKGMHESGTQGDLKFHEQNLTWLRSTKANKAKITWKEPPPGTHNYVIFRGKDIKILEKMSMLAGTTAVGGAGLGASALIEALNKKKKKAAP